MTDESSEGGTPPDGATPPDGTAPPPDGTIPVIVEGPGTEDVELGTDPGTDPGIDPGPARLAQLEGALQVAEKEKKDNWDKYVRAVADLENRQKRSKRELEDAKIDAKIKVLKEMLPVVDNLERAIEHAHGPTSDPNAILEGVRLVLRQFHHAFERLEVTPVEADGQPFDPNIHEAISQIDSDDQPPGTVMSVLQKGYRIGDRLLRPAMVIVARAKAGA